jgi:hypothetical protein
MKISSRPLTGPGSEGEIFTVKRPDGAVCDHGERAIKAARRLTANLDFKRILLEYSL